MSEKSRITYAKRFLLNLLLARKLNSWCEERKLPHTTVYNLAAGDFPPTYSVICKLLPYIEPAKWFYSEGEEIPYKTRLLPEWNPDDVPYFVRRHRYDYKELIEKYGISESSALNLFINHRAKPSINLIAKACAEGINPEEFFTLGDTDEDGKFYPDRGDIVSIFGKTMLVLSKRKVNRECRFFIGVEYKDGRADLQTIAGVTYVRVNPVLTGKADSETLKSILHQVKDILN